MKQGARVIALIASLGLAGSEGAFAGSLVPPMTNGVPSEFALRRAGADVGANLRVRIAREGLHKVTYSDFAAAGITSVVGSQVRMYWTTQEIAIATSTQSTWTTNDYALFWGWPHDGLFTDTNAYWLALTGTGVRMQTRNAAPIPSSGDVTSHWRTVRYDTSAIFNPFYLPLVESFDHFVSLLIVSSADSTYTVAVTNGHSTHSASMRLGLWGVSSDVGVNPDHVTKVSVNGTQIASILNDGQAYTTGIALPAAGQFNPNGINTITLRQIGTPTNDTAALDSADFTYLASNRPIADVLLWNGIAGATNYAAQPFLATDGIVLDVTDRANPVILTNATWTGVTGGRQVRFSDTAVTSNRYWVGGVSNAPSAGPVSVVYFHELADTNRQADYIIICSPENRASAYRLAKQRTLQNLRSLVVPLRTVFYEFSYGIKDADAIKQFIGYAYHHWKKPSPRYVVLVGDGTYDPRNYLNVADYHDSIPVHLGASATEYCSQDGWYGTVNGSDLLTDVAIGRIPIRTEASFSNVVSKLVQYEATSVTNAWKKKALAVADGFDVTAGLDFSGSSESNFVQDVFFGGVTDITRAYLDDNSPPVVRATITNTINSGVLAVSYFGHGFSDFWSSTMIFETNDVPKLNNSVWPVFTMVTCENGDFDDPFKECIGEALLERANRGAIVSAAAGALSIPGAADVFANGFSTALVTSNSYKRVGDMFNKGLLDLWTFAPTASELLFYNLMGDPATRIHP